MPFAAPPPASQKRSSSKSSDKASLLRPKILSDEEKRQLIMAHAASRKPIDHVQRVSLVAGVLICALAIGTGWIYSVRMSMAEVFPKTGESDSAETAAEARLRYQEDIKEGTQSIIQEIEKIEREEILPNIKSALVATTTPAAATSTAKENAKAKNLPPGLTTDSKE